MVARSDFNIDALKYPDILDTGKSPTPTKSLSDRVNTAFKTDTASPSEDKEVSIPEGISPIDYKMFLIVEGFLQPNSTVTLKDMIDILLDIFPDGDMRFINSICLELAEQIPYSHPSHAKLARLLWGVERSEARIEKMKRKVYLYALPRLLKNFFDPTFVVTRLRIRIPRSEPRAFVKPSKKTS